MQRILIVAILSFISCSVLSHPCKANQPSIERELNEHWTVMEVAINEKFTIFSNIEMEKPWQLVSCPQGISCTGEFLKAPDKGGDYGMQSWDFTAQVSGGYTLLFERSNGWQQHMTIIVRDKK